MVGVNWIDLAQGRGMWWTAVKVATNLQFPVMVTFLFVSSQKTIILIYWNDCLVVVRIAD
jgi:hypothetical protein